MILLAARWCFLNFGFAKTSLDDIARRAGISRTLLYKTFADKEDIYRAVFRHWLVSRHPLAKAAVNGNGTPSDRLLEACRIMMIEPWADMISAPMAGEFFEVCGRLDPEVDALHRRVGQDCFNVILQDEAASEVFLLCLDGLVGDAPSVALLEQRVRLVIEKFV